MLCRGRSDSTLALLIAGASVANFTPVCPHKSHRRAKTARTIKTARTTRTGERTAHPLTFTCKGAVCPDRAAPTTSSHARNRLTPPGGIRLTQKRTPPAPALVETVKERLSPRLALCYGSRSASRIAVVPIRSRVSRHSRQNQFHGIEILQRKELPTGNSFG